MPLNPDIKRLFDGPNYAHVATLMADGSPVVAPLWVGTEGDRIVFFKHAESLGYRNLRRDPRVAISIVAIDNPYLGAYVRGEAVEFREGPQAPRWLTETAHKYIGGPYPPEYLKTVVPGVLILVEVERSTDFDVPYMKHVPFQSAP